MFTISCQCLSNNSDYLRFNFKRNFTSSNSFLCISGRFDSDITRVTIDRGAVDRILQSIKLFKNQLKSNQVETHVRVVRSDADASSVVIGSVVGTI